MSEQLLLRVEDTAKALNISRAQLYPRLMSGEIPSIRIGRSRRIPLEALRDWIERQVEEGAIDGR